VRKRVIVRHISGESNRRISAEEQIDRGTVARILTGSEGAALIARYREQLLAMVPQAMAVYKQLLNSKDERVRAAAATKILEWLLVFPKGGVCPEQTMPEQDNDQRKLLFLGQITEMMLYKQRRYGVPLPPIFDELKLAELQPGPVRGS
jgi:hypothetical protein